jgi:predicted acyltransferase
MNPSRRLLSLDVFRGLTIAGMILVNSPGNRTAYAPLEHAEWNGWTPTDLVFPFFVFIVGVSLVFSFAQRRESGHAQADLLRQILKRTVIIFGLGLLLNGFPYYHLDTIRIPGVLQRIALCYGITALLYLRFSLKTLAWLAGAALVVYWQLMTRMPVPGFGAGVLTPEGNLAGYIDRLFFIGHMYTPHFDPEGILSTLPAVVTALLGVFAGNWIRQHPAHKGGALIGAGCIGILTGCAWGRFFPINKALWTSSYVLFTGGLALALLGLCHWTIEVKGWRGWSRFFEVFGVNGFAAYFLSILDLKIQNRISVNIPGVEDGNLRLLITRTLFESWASPQTASLLYAAAHTLIWFMILSALYRRRVFIKI